MDSFCLTKTLLYVSISKCIFNAIDKQLCSANQSFVHRQWMHNEGLDLEAIQVHKQLRAEKYALCNYILINYIIRFKKSWSCNCKICIWFLVTNLSTFYIQCWNLFEAPLDPIFSFSMSIPASFIIFICWLKWHSLLPFNSRYESIPVNWAHAEAE